MAITWLVAAVALVPPIMIRALPETATRELEDIAPERLLPGADSGHHHRGDTALHVVRASSNQRAVDLVCGKWVAVEPGQGDDVDVPVEHERASAAGAASDADDGWPAGCGFQPVDLEAVVNIPFTLPRAF